jgi:hypothetical protein
MASSPYLIGISKRGRWSGSSGPERFPAPRSKTMPMTAPAFNALSRHSTIDIQLTYL